MNKKHCDICDKVLPEDTSIGFVVIKHDNNLYIVNPVMTASYKHPLSKLVKDLCPQCQADLLGDASFMSKKDHDAYVSAKGVKDKAGKTEALRTQPT